MTLLQVKNLRVEFLQRGRALEALKGISFTIEDGESLGIVGESGAGKSVAAFAILNLISKPGRICGGEILFKGEDLTKASRRRLREIRGNRIAMIFQDPMMTLNPVLTIGTQMTESLKAHRSISSRKARELALDMLHEVAIPDPLSRFKAYPHELSGGMRQRIVIATALLTEPDLIIADEPTTALDVTIQAEIMALIAELCRRHGTSLLLITHDIALVSQVTERLAIFYSGRIVEEGPTDKLIKQPLHPYTEGLLACLPQNNPPGQPLAQIPGSMPPLEIQIPGCEFHPRCHKAIEACTMTPPDLWRFGNRFVACYKASLPATPQTLQQETKILEERAKKAATQPYHRREEDKEQLAAAKYLHPKASTNTPAAAKATKNASDAATQSVSETSQGSTPAQRSGKIKA